MNTDQDSLIEAQLEKSVRKAFRQLLKDIENEPTLVIETEADGASEPDQSLEDIQGWLFRRRQKNGCRDDKAAN